MTIFRVDLWPTTKPTYVPLIIISCLSLLLGLAVLVTTVYRDGDLFINGVIEQATVKSVKAIEDEKGGGGKAYLAISYLHTIRYAGHEMRLDQRVKIPEKSAIDVYYSAKNPDNAVLKTAEHPFKTWIAVIGSNDARKFWTIDIFLAILCAILIRGYKRAKPASQL